MGIRSDLGVIKMYIEGKWVEIDCGKPKVEIKQDTNLRTACNSQEPYEMNPGAIEYSIEIPEINHNQAWIFKNIMTRQKNGKMKNKPSLVIYSYNEQGKLHKDYHFQGVYFESMSQEGNEPFDMKGGALTSVPVTTAKTTTTTNTTSNT